VGIKSGMSIKQNHLISRVYLHYNPIYFLKIFFILKYIKIIFLYHNIKIIKNTLFLLLNSICHCDNICFLEYFLFKNILK
jgi:hypothetical protein